MIYGYARVSTLGQKSDGNSLEEQDIQLREHGAVKVYVDTFTGTKMDRPEFSKLLQTVQEGDTIVATKLDRISRSASQGIVLVDDLISKGVSLNILNMGVLNNTPTGKLIRNVMFSFAEFERDMIVQRTMEGKAIARQKPDYKEGRKKKECPRFSEYKAKVEAKKISIAEAVRELGISRSTWYNLSNAQ